MVCAVFFVAVFATIHRPTELVPLRLWNGSFVNGQLIGYLLCRDIACAAEITLTKIADFFWNYFQNITSESIALTVATAFANIAAALFY